MDLGLDGKVAVVTGASKGIGLAVVHALVDEGVHVIAGSRTIPIELEELTRSGAVEAVAVDLSTPDGPAHLVSHAGDRLDILVNNVGAVVPHVGGFLSVTDEEWEASMNLNFMSAVRATRSALPLMLAARRGVVINMSSVNAFLPTPQVIDYSVAKAALTNFSKALSKEVGPSGIRVNTISPGPVATDLWLGPDGVGATLGRASGAAPEDVAAAAVRGTPTGRFTQPSEVADLVVLLASDRTANVTGTDWTIDGGLIATL